MSKIDRQEIEGSIAAPTGTLEDIGREEETKEWMAEPGTIYLIACGGTRAVKVGFTQSPVGERLAQLQTGCPSELRIVACWRGSRSTEKNLHSILTRRGRHLRGEWFDFGVDPDELRATDGMDGNAICLRFQRGFIEAQGGLQAIAARIGVSNGG